MTLASDRTSNWGPGESRPRLLFLPVLLLALVLPRTPARPVPAPDAEHELVQLLSSGDTNGLQKLQAIDAWLEHWRSQVDLPRLAQRLEGRAGLAAEYARALLACAGGAVWQGRAALQRLERRADKMPRKTAEGCRLQAQLQLALGRARLWLGHNRRARQHLEHSRRLTQECGTDRDRVRVLVELADLLVNHSRLPAEALPVINELLVRARASGQEDAVARAKVLYQQWHTQLAQVDDHFGRAHHRLQEFPYHLGIPTDADLVGWHDGVLVLNGDTDDQLQAAAPRLVAFDGLFFRTWQLPHPRLELRGSLLDGQGRLWAASNCGIYRLEGERLLHLVNDELGAEAGNRLERILDAETRLGVARQKLELASNIVNELKQGPDGLFYAATAAGVTVFDEAGRVHERIDSSNAPIPTVIERVAPAPGPRLALAWRDAYAVRGPDGRWRRFPFRFPPAAGRPHPRLFGLLVDSGGGIWVHGLGGAMLVDEHGPRRLVDRRFSPVTRNVNHVLLARDGAWWFASTDGLCRQSGNHCDTLSAERWLPAEWVLDLLEDERGAVWFSAYQGGLYALLPDPNRRLGVADGLRQPVNYDLCRLGAYLYTTHGEGLSRIHPQSGQVDNFVSGAEGIPPGELDTCLELDGRWLVLHGPEVLQGKGVVLFDGHSGRVIGAQQGLPADERVSAFCSDAPGQLLLATAEQLWHWRVDDGRARPAAGCEELGRHQVTALACRPGQGGWALTRSGELARLEPGTSAWRWERDLRRLLGGRPRHLVQARSGDTFVFARHGAARFVKGRWQRWEPGCADFDYRVRRAARDAQGRFFFSSQSGLFVTSKDLCTRLGEADGLTSDTSFGLLPDDDKQVMWVAGARGVARFSWPQAEPPETLLEVGQRVYFTDRQGRPRRWYRGKTESGQGVVRIEGLAGSFLVPRDDLGPLLQGSRAPAGKTPAQCRPGDGWLQRNPRLQVRLSGAVPYRDDSPDSLSYQYRLDGSAWQTVSGRRLELTDLADGAHWLEVRAGDRYLHFDPSPARLCFRVDTPLPAWLGWLGGLLVGLLGYGNRKRLRLLVQRWRLRHFRPIEPNPFTPERPASTELTVGRESQLDQLEEMACRRGGAALVWGPEGSGKSTLVARLRERLGAAGCLVAEVDLALSKASARAATALLDLTAQLQSFRIRSDPAPGDTPVSAEAENDPFRRLDLLLEELARGGSPRRTVLLIGGTELLAMDESETGDAPGNLFSYLRALLQRHSFLTVVLSMRGRWFDLSARFRTLLAFATPVPTGRLEDDDVDRLYRRALAGRVVLGDAARATLLELVGGDPAVAQLFGARLVEHLNRAGSNLCRARDLEEIAARLSEDETAPLRRTWQDRNRQERLVLAALAGSRSGQKEQELERTLHEHGVRLLPEELRRTLLALERDGTVASWAGILRIRGELHRRWIAHHHPVRQVLEEGHEYVGHYRLLRRLGSGGMGVVWEARDLASDSLVALKLMRPELCGSERSRRRFLREARVGRRVQHPNLVHILDYGEQAGRLYLAMELCQGITLDRWRREQSFIPVACALAMARDLAEALVALHRAGILHRDIKSENVMVLPDEHGSLSSAPRLKLMDFGLAAVAAESRMTRAGTLLGTVACMSPEQAQGRQVDERSDIYSLGVLLYELLGGRPPFQGEEAVVLHDIIYREVPPLCRLAPGVPGPVAELVEAMLAKDPAARPASAAEVVDRLQQLLAAELSAGSAAAVSGGARDASTSRVRSRTVEAFGLSSPLLGTPTASRAGTTSSAPSVLLLQVAAALTRGPLEDNEQEVLGLVQAALLADGLMLFVLQEERLRLLHQVGEPCELLQPGDEWLQKQLQDCRRRGQVVVVEVESDEGDRASLLASPLLGERRVTGVLAVVRSGSGQGEFTEHERELAVACGQLLGMGLERDRLTRQLLDQQRLAVAGQMLAGVAHDLRGPLTVVSGYAELAGEEASNSERRHYTEVIQRQVEQMNQMIGNLMTFVRGVEKAPRERLLLERLAEQIRRQLDPLCEARRVELVVTCQGEQAWAEASRLLRIAYNLGKNAVEALANGGRVEVLLRREPGRLLLEVCDNGPGIPASERARLFEPFFTRRKQGGTGIGLFVVKRLVEELDGHIEVESVPGQGACFRVWLPQVQA